MISNGLRWYYIAITKLSILLKGITSAHVEIKSPSVLECLLKKYDIKSFSIQKNLVIHFKALSKKASVLKNNYKKLFTIKISEKILRG